MARGERGAPGVTRRGVRLLVLLGLAVAAYLVLTLFDHAARADEGLADRLPGTAVPADAVKAATADVTKIAHEPKRSVPKQTAPKQTAPTRSVPKVAVPKPSAPKVHSQSTHRPRITTPEVHAPKTPAAKKLHTPKLHTPKLHTPKLHAPLKIPSAEVRTGETVRRVRAGTSKLRQTLSDAVQEAARGAVTPARTLVSRQPLPTLAPLLPLPDLTALRDLAPIELPTLPQVEVPALPDLPQVELSTLPERPALPPLPGPAPPRPPVPAQMHLLAQAPASGLPGVTEPPARQTPVTEPPALHPPLRTSPSPATPLPAQPAGHPTPGGQARDSGGGTAPVMGTLASTWWPELAAAGRRAAIDLLACGRTVRHAGPPS
ncbi:hypothetical protein [Actinoplanes palleronii]|uniref:hypothetical protein n=1 Tax=Actinoplanes palleronii TaxID=113570 RepID=UPI00194075B8|nr:hypothetical protein [Actinoplanes palleronii]